MFTMNVPKTFRFEALKTVVFLMNRMPSRVIQYKTPLELLSSSSSLFPLSPKTFGCICFVHIPKFDRNKLESKSLKCIFLRYVTT